jgi:hypothetical protein
MSTSIPATRYSSSPLRHLAWLLSAPPLWQEAWRWHLSPHEQDRIRMTLDHWAAHPEAGPAFLSDTPPPRLGLYFERLYDCLMTELLGWEKVINNLPIRGQGRTLGELDFIFRNPDTGELEHHEIAVKFYLGHPAPDGIEPLWYGPNARDRLDLKTRHLREHQSRLTRRPETTEALRALGIDTPRTARVIMPGYLFYPWQEDYPAPVQAPPDHLRGHWLYLEDIEQVDTRHWVPLKKPHWLGPWMQTSTPDVKATQATLAQIHERATPRLFSALAPDPESGYWVERDRFFVMPGAWPDRA